MGYLVRGAAPRDANRHVIVLLAVALALDAADKGAVGALGPVLQHDFHIDNSDLGLLATIVSVVSAAATVPAGALVDRMSRINLLAVSIVLWSVAMAASAAAPDYGWLLVSRAFLGVVLATTAPVVASLIGDLFKPGGRSRALSSIEVGELAGLGVGLVVSGGVLLVLSWRWVFVLLSAVGVCLAIVMMRAREPLRTESDCGHRREGLWRATKEVVRIRTNVVVVVAGAIGYFFFSAVRIFAVLFVTQQYGVSTSTAALLVPIIGIGAIGGLLAGGRWGDRTVRRGWAEGRLVLAMMGYLLAAGALVPVLFLHSLVLATPFIVLAGVGLAAPNPALDAVRIDVVPASLWGRAEGIRTVVRTFAEASAPFALGILADHLAGGGAAGVRLALLVTLPALALSGVVLGWAFMSYRHDAARVGTQLPVSPHVVTPS